MPETPSLDSTRCSICGWPLVAEPRQGCVPRNCSMRPWPKRYYDPVRAHAEYGDTLPREEDPYLGSPEQLRDAEEARLKGLVSALVSLAKQATNGWACHARTKREHEDIARLHREIDAVEVGRCVSAASALADACVQLKSVLEDYDLLDPVHGLDARVDAAVRAAVAALAREVGRQIPCQSERGGPCAPPA